MIIVLHLLTSSAPAPPSGTPSHYYSVRCNGTEESIAQCTSKSGINTTICTTSRAAHVVCRKGDTVNLYIPWIDVVA